MSGHSQFANIMHRKGAQDKKRAKIFQRIVREISVAVKTGGTNPTSNAKLRTILEKAKAVNMPKDIIKRAIDKAANQEDNEHYEALTYEGYGPSSVAFIVHCLTDNKNRTASNIRSYFTKCHGKLGATNSVQYLFNKVGIIEFNTELSLDTILEMIIDYDVFDWSQHNDEDQNIVTLLVNPEQLSVIVKCLGNHEINNLMTNEIRNLAIEPIIVSDESDFSLNQKLITLFEDDDDVLYVEHNLQI